MPLWLSRGIRGLALFLVITLNRSGVQKRFRNDSGRHENHLQDLFLDEEVVADHGVAEEVKVIYQQHRFYARLQHITNTLQTQTSTQVCSPRNIGFSLPLGRYCIEFGSTIFLQFWGLQL